MFEETGQGLKSESLRKTGAGNEVTEQQQWQQ